MVKSSKKIVILLFSILLIVGILTYFIALPYYNKVQFKPYLTSLYLFSTPEKNVTEACYNLNAVETGYCLWNYIKPYYNYNITDEDYYDLETLKAVGGDCYNYALWYGDMASQLGINQQLEIYVLSDTAAHAVTIISDSEGYCFMDLDDVRCYETDAPRLPKSQLDKDELSKEKYDEIIKDCKNLPFTNTIGCVQRNFYPYYYKNANAAESCISFGTKCDQLEIKADPTDDYVYIYQDLMKDLGYSDSVVLELKDEDDLYHPLLHIYQLKNNIGVTCYIDRISYDCSYFNLQTFSDLFF